MIDSGVSYHTKTVWRVTEILISGTPQDPYNFRMMVLDWRWDTLVQLPHLLEEEAEHLMDWVS